MINNDKDRCDFAPYYTTVAGGRLFRWLDLAKKRVAKRVLSSLPEESQVLDLGSGAAAISASLARLFPHLNFHAADSNESLLEIAKSRGLPTKIVDFDHDLPYASETFDLVLMIDTIEHVECRTETMRQVKRILKSDGRLLVFTPPYDSILWLFGERFFNIITGRPADHICPFTRESLEWLFKRHFAQSKTGYLNFGLTMWGLGEGKTN